MDWIAYAVVCQSHYPRHLLGAFPVEGDAEEYARREGNCKVQKFFRLATAAEQTRVQECGDHRRGRRRVS